jgi:hypothetical protein
VGPGIRELVRRCSSPEALFSPIIGKARKEDVKPEAVVAWTSGETHDGKEYPLPSCSLVTSRLSVSSPKTSHYALVCFSEKALVPCAQGYILTFNTLRNLVSGSQVGASQVTAVVVRDDSKASIGGRVYEVAFRAHLVHPYFVRLRQPVVVSDSAHPHGNWTALVESLWNHRLTDARLAGALESSL